MTTPTERTDLRLAANLPRYYAYVVSRNLSFGLIAAFWVIYFQRYRGLTMTQITLTDLAFWLAMTLGEVPTGVVADRYGRKISIVIGSVISAAGLIAWTISPTLPLIVASNVLFGIGLTFVSGAEDALLFETISKLGRVGEYTRIVGRVGAIALGALAFGNLVSGLLGVIDLRIPMILSCIFLLMTFAIALTFREPHGEERAIQHREGYGTILRHAFTLLRENAALRYALFYLTLVPVAAFLLEIIFLQPQALAMGVPLAAVGAVVMSMQFVKMVGSAGSYRVKSRFGDEGVIFVAPFLIALCLILLGLFQTLPALLFAALISFFTAIIRPLLITRIQSLVTDNIRATVLSLQSLLFSALIAVVEPSMGVLVDKSGLPSAFYALAATLIVLSLLLFWKSRPHFP